MIEWIICTIIHDELMNGVPSWGFIHQNILGEWHCHHVIQMMSCGSQGQLIQTLMRELNYQEQGSNHPSYDLNVGQPHLLSATRVRIYWGLGSLSRGTVCLVDAFTDQNSREPGVKWATSLMGV